MHTMFDEAGLYSLTRGQLLTFMQGLSIEIPEATKPNKQELIALIMADMRKRGLDGRRTSR